MLSPRTRKSFATRSHERLARPSPNSRGRLSESWRRGAARSVRSMDSILCRALTLFKIFVCEFRFRGRRAQHPREKESEHVVAIRLIPEFAFRTITRNMLRRSVSFSSLESRPKKRRSLFEMTFLAAREIHIIHEIFLSMHSTRSERFVCKWMDANFSKVKAHLFRQYGS